MTIRITTPDDGIRLGDGSVRLGRAARKTDGVPALTIGSHDPAVSRVAAVIERRGDLWELRNVSKSNPIAVQSPHHGETSVPPGGRLVLDDGHSTLLFGGKFGPHPVQVTCDQGPRADTLGGDTLGSLDRTVTIEPPDPILRRWFGIRYAEYIDPGQRRPQPVPPRAAFERFSELYNVDVTEKSLTRREEKFKENLDQIVGGLSGRENTHRFANELVQRGFLRPEDLPEAT